MDASRFDALTRVVMTTGARRSVLRGLASAVLGGPLGLLGPAGTEWVDARNKKKNKGKNKKKRTCKPSCTAPMTCQRGTCDCPGGTVLCKGECYVNTCNAGLAYSPLTCECCRANDSSGCFSGPPSCCSNACHPVGNVCLGRGIGASCDFSAQCDSGFCGPTGVCVLFLPTP